VKVTEPVGVDAPAPFVSATVTVHEIDWAITTDAGHVTVVEVVRRFTVTEAVPKLVAWIVVETKSPRTVAAPAAVPLTLIVQLPVVNAQLAGPETPPV